MRFHDLCNRLDVTSTHKFSDFRAQRLRATDRDFARLPESRALARAGKDELRNDAELPLPEGSTPDDAAVGAADTSCVPVRPLARDPVHEAEG